MSEIKSFIWIALVWLVLGIVLNLVFSSSAFWFSVFWGLCVGNLFFLAKTISSAILLMSHVNSTERPQMIFRTAFFGVLKLITLGCIGFFLYVVESIPGPSIVFGLGTMVVVPFFGGYLWSKRGRWQYAW